MKNILGNILAVIYFIVPMLMVLLMLLFTPVGFLMDANTVLSSGFAGPNNYMAFVGICGLSTGVSLLIPPLRRIYRALPWLYSFIKIFFINMIILVIGIMILNFGYEVNTESRHTAFFLLMLAQIIVCRVAMCLYFKWKPVQSVKEG
jgi:hypothetical protein